MSGGEKKTNPYESPRHGDERGLESSWAFAVLFVACIAGVLLSIAVSGHAVLKILETTRFMGITVDARGNPIPIQGYPQLGFGLAGALLFFLCLRLFSDCIGLESETRAIAEQPGAREAAIASGMMVGSLAPLACPGSLPRTGGF